MTQGPATPDETAVALPREVRKRLVATAAEVAGRHPVSDLPAGVRRFARFAPAKRLRLGGPELAAALEADASFRGLVAEEVAESTPELAELIRRGTPPAGADPADVAVLVYLLRPTGWPHLLGAAASALADHSDRRLAGAEVGRLRAEVDRLAAANAELVRAQDAARSTARAGTSEQSRELSELSHRIRTLTGVLRAAQRQARQYEAELSGARTQLDRVTDTASVELRKARARIAALEADVDAGRRSARAGRDHDDARVWVLLEQLGGAITGLRRELDIGRPAVLPADSVAGSVPGAAIRPASVDGSLLERLLDGAHVHLIVDGYNLTKTGYPSLTLADQRSRLVASLGALAARTRVEVTVAFDGTAAPTGAAASLPTPRGVRVLFSAPGELADDLIRRLLQAEPEGRTVVVASSDGAVAASVRGAGGWPVTAAVLLSRIER
jgi:predicted RNA-binding protein with PIN domain